MSLLQLPIELLIELFEHLWDDHQALSACTLTCHRLQPVCQKALFFQITLNTAARGAESRVDLLSQFDWVLREQPHLVSYVVRLDIEIIGRQAPWLLYPPYQEST